jgi:hypothetical protein
MGKDSSMQRITAMDMSVVGQTNRLGGRIGSFATQCTDQGNQPVSKKDQEEPAEEDQVLNLINKVQMF